MASRAKGDHQCKNRLPRYAMMNDDGSFVATGSIAHPAAVTVPFEHFLAKPSKVFLILPLERVADRAHPMRENLRLPAPAVHHVLFGLRHHITRSVFARTTTSTSQPSTKKTEFWSVRTVKISAGLLHPRPHRRNLLQSLHLQARFRRECCTEPASLTSLPRYS